MASWAGADADGDTVTVLYDWQVNGVSVSSAESIVVGDHASKYDYVTVALTPFDGTDTGIPLTGRPAFVGNSPPVIERVDITPVAPTDADNLTCTVTASDPDGDTLTTTVRWWVSGRWIGRVNPLSSVLTSSGDTAMCDVEVHDSSVVVSATNSVAVSLSCTGTCPASFSEGDLLITEIMVDPNAVTDAAGEWFEVVNHYGSRVNLKGMTLTDDGGSHVVLDDVSIDDGDIAVFCAEDNPAGNGGVTCDYEYGSDLLFDNAGDFLELSYGSTTFDEVDFGYLSTAWSIPSGAALALAFQITVTQSGVLESFGAFSYWTGYAYMDVALYEDSGGAPGALVAEVINVREGNAYSGYSLNHWSVRPDDGALWIEPGTYWLATSGNYASAAGHFIINDSSSSVCYAVGRTQGSAWPDPFGGTRCSSAERELLNYLNIVEF